MSDYPTPSLVAHNEAVIRAAVEAARPSDAAGLVLDVAVLPDNRTVRVAVCTEASAGAVELVAETWRLKGAAVLGGGRPLWRRAVEALDALAAPVLDEVRRRAVAANEATVREVVEAARPERADGLRLDVAVTPENTRVRVTVGVFTVAARDVVELTAIEATWAGLPDGWVERLWSDAVAAVEALAEGQGPDDRFGDAAPFRPDISRW